MKMISEVQEGRILGFRFACGGLGLSTGVSVVVLRGCMAPDDLPPWGVRVVIGIVVLIDGSSNRQSSAFRILLNRSALAAPMPHPLRERVCGSIDLT